MMKKILVLSELDNPTLFENRIVKNLFFSKKCRSDIFDYEKINVINSALSYLKIIQCKNNIGQLANNVNDCVQLTYIKLIPEYQEKLTQILKSETRRELHTHLFNFLKDVTYITPNEEAILDILVPKSVLEYLLYDRGITSIKQMSKILKVSEVDIKRQFEYMDIL